MAIFAAGDAMSHVLDSNEWHLFEVPHIGFTIPPLFDMPFNLGPFRITKYTILMFIAAGLVAWIYIPLSKRIQSGEAPKGIWWNFWESMLTFIRDNVAKPYLSGHHDHHDDGHGHGHSGHAADQFVPYLWTTFLFVLFCNLLGMLPFMGSPTASFTVTLTLAIIVYFMIQISGIMQHGFVHYLQVFAPPMDLPIYLKIPIMLMLWPIEFFGLVLKCFILSVRLFANMFAGHMVLASILLFITAASAAGPALFWGVTAASVIGVTLLSLLELFVAFLQAFLFTFLTALFLGSVVHPEH